MTDKASTYTMRLPGELKQKFEAIAKANDRTAAQLVRDYMRWYIHAHENPESHPELQQAKRGQK